MSIINLIDLRNGNYLKLTEFLNRRIESNDVSDVVSKILNNVKNNGDNALTEYTKKFDSVDLTSFKVSEEEIEEAYTKVEQDLIEVIRKAISNIKNFHERQKADSIFYEKNAGIKLGMLRRPISCIGVYVPGGNSPLPSSVLMNVIPAKVAGVKKIIMATPPNKEGKVTPIILVAAKEAGVDEIYKVGGAQAIAALAYGTKSIPKVDKIVGPGNMYVATAKKLVFGVCDIDMIAGPSEILVLADENANPKFIAADLLSQVEHDRMASSILITTSEELAKKVEEEVVQQLKDLPKSEIAESSLKNFGAIVLVKNTDQAIDAANTVAPEHLEICLENPEQYVDRIENAGAIFLGNYTPEPLGDYFAGPNHVLPTTGTARFFSPLNVWDFIKQTSVIYYSKDALNACGKDVAKFARSEDLEAHARSIEVRLNEQ